MRISDFIARTITQRRALVWAGVAVVTIACIAILVTSLRLDSEVFNVLPARYSSVQGLKIYDRDFEQTRELTFALVCNPNDVDKLKAFAISNRWRCRYFSIWNRRLSIKRSRSCNRTKFAIVFIDCGNRLRQARLGR